MSTPTSFYRRPLPDGHVAFASNEGRQIFREALAAGTMEGWFALSEQFHTQADPSFCGLGTLVMALNALEIDPGRIWKGPWRWYGEELLDCCQPIEQVKRNGLTLDEVACLAQCNGAQVDLVRADAVDAAALRTALRVSSSTPRGPVLIASYSRAALGQTGSGHFSPLAGYHPDRDLALILDVARFKYPPHWVPVQGLWRAMTDVDPASGRARGWLSLQRAHQRALPLSLRFGGDVGFSQLIEVLLRRVVALLANAKGATAKDVVAQWVGQVEASLAVELLRCVQRVEPVGSMPAEHERAITAIREQLRASDLFHAVSASRTAGAPGAIEDDVLAMLLLALPEVVLAGVQPAIAAALRPLRSPAGVELGREVAALREQLQALYEWRGDVP